MGSKKTYPKDSQFKLCIVDENADMMMDTLGIIDSRAKEIAEITKKAYEGHQKKTDSLQEIFDHCVHINEVVFAYECFNRVHELKAHEHRLHGLMDKLFGNG